MRFKKGFSQKKGMSFLGAFDIYIFCDKLVANRDLNFNEMEVWTLIVLNLTEREAQTLKGILLVEQEELKDLIETSNDVKDKKELEGELARVEKIMHQID